ncbi:MAG: biopolymer transporter ExbD [Verrucomicrobiota bacterium]|nr:biopolymer transporter ExbD [Verrucomicrobiota bacterium]
MRKERIPSRYAPGGLRARFFPKSRIGHGLIALAPWLNIALLLMFFALVFSRIVVQPGYVVDMPAAPFADGLRPLITAVALSLEPTGGGDREEVIFFDDVRFKIGREKQWDRLKQAMSEFLRQRPGADLTILADSRVRYGTLVQLITLAKDVGIEKVNLAYRERMESKADK